VLLEQMERVAVADRQAGMTAAVMARDENYTPLDVFARLEEWEAWLAADPSEQPAGESFADRVIRFQQAVEQRDAEIEQMTGVA
jgi:hypothetical protein